MRNVNIRAVVLVSAVAILLVESFFIYRFYADNYMGVSSGDGSTTSITETTRESTAPEGTAPEGITFVHRATPGNTSANSTFLDHPQVDGDPNAILLVTPVSDSRDAAENPHEIGVWYYEPAGKWAIYNQDLAPMPAGATFNVMVLEGEGAIVHRATVNNTTGDTTYINDPLTNGAPEALLSVTQNFNPGGGIGVYNDHPVGVRYDAGRERWGIFNRDHEPIPEGSAFNVAVSQLPG